MFEAGGNLQLAVVFPNKPLGQSKSPDISDSSRESPVDSSCGPLGVTASTA